MDLVSVQKFGGSVFKPLVGEALSRLNVVIRDPNALQAENIMAYDNAVSALGKICQFHRDGIDSAQPVIVIRDDLTFILGTCNKTWWHLQQDMVYVKVRLLTHIKRK
ncbi:Importin-5 [Sarracenia purpurea var. burkii]